MCLSCFFFGRNPAFSPSVARAMPAQWDRTSCVSTAYGPNRYPPLTLPTGTRWMRKGDRGTSGCMSTKSNSRPDLDLGYYLNTLSLSPLSPSPGRGLSAPHLISSDHSSLFYFGPLMLQHGASSIPNWYRGEVLLRMCRVQLGSIISCFEATTRATAVSSIKTFHCLLCLRSKT